MVRQRTEQRTTSRKGSAIRKLAGSTLVNIQQGGSPVTYVSTCSDLLGRKTDHPLYIDRVQKTWTPLNGRVPANDFQTYREYVNYDCYSSRADAAHIDLNPPSETASITLAMARTNPSRPVVSLPTFLGELKDFKNLPLNIRDKGRVVINQLRTARSQHKKGRYDPKKLSDAYLAYSFAIAPLVSDVQKLVNFQQAVDKKMDDLDRLFAKGGMRRRISVFNQSAQVDQSNFAIESALGVVFTTRISTATSMKRWCTLRWVPIFSRPYKSDAEKQKLARDLALGLNVHGAVETAWELIPWSFMTDWFTGVGTYLQAHNNSVPAQAVRRCVMTYQRTTVTYTRSDNNVAYSGGNATFTRESKRRSTGLGTSLDVRLPFLSGNQLSILGALAVSHG